MNTHQLQCAIECDPFMRKTVLGVFSADRIPNIPNHRPVGFIVNTDPIQAPGRHWISFFINKDNVIECFDSYGKHPKELSKYIAIFLSRFKNIEINDKRLQSFKTNVCGQYCLFYLMCRCRGFSMLRTLRHFDNNLLDNDEFVYNFINDRFFCSMYKCRGLKQVCLCES